MATRVTLPASRFAPMQESRHGQPSVIADVRKCITLFATGTKPHTMKPTAILAATIAILASFSAPAQESPPTLSLSKAAQIAETTLKSLGLPAEYFIRSISLSPELDPFGKVTYEAQFEPRVRKIIMKRDDPALDSPQTIKYRVIVVSMDGVGKVEDRERPMMRSIVRRRDAAGPTTTTNK